MKLPQLGDYRVTPLIFMITALALSLGCGARSPDIASPPPTPGLVRPSEYLPELSALETCRNGVDDNENGFIDEGCGEGRASRLEFYLAWAEPKLALDLLVYDPEGGVAEVGRATKLGLVKLLECPEESECQGQNYEKVVLERETPIASGAYRVVVEVNGDFPESRAYQFQLGLVERRRTRAFRAELSPLQRRAEMIVEVVSEEPAGETPSAPRASR